MARSINFAYEVVSFLSLAGTTQTNKLQMSRFILNLWTRFSLFPRTLKALAQYFPLCSLKIYVLKKFVPSSLPPPRTHFDFITTKCMITTVCCLKKREQQIDSVIPSDDLSKKEGLCNWNLETSRLSFSSRWLWPNFRMCFIQAVHLSFKKFNSLFGKIPTIPPTGIVLNFIPCFKSRIVL